MAERQDVKVSVHKQTVWGSVIDGNKYHADTVKGLIEWLGQMLLLVPEEYRDSAQFEVESVGGYEGEHHSEVEISYRRPETDEEMNIRSARAQARLEEEVRRHEQYAAQARARLARS